MANPMQRICSDNQGFKSKDPLTVSLPGKVSKSPPPLGGAYLTYPNPGREGERVMRCPKNGTQRTGPRARPELKLKIKSGICYQAVAQAWETHNWQGLKDEQRISYP